MRTPKRTTGQRNQRSSATVTPVDFLPIPEFPVRKKTSFSTSEFLRAVELANPAGVEVGSACWLAGFVSVAHNWKRY